MSAASISSAAIADWRQFLNEAGDAARVQSAAIVDIISAVEQGQRDSIDLGRFVASLERVAEKINAPGLSWHAGQYARASLDGPVGKAALSVKTLGECLLRLSALYHLIQESTVLRLDIDDRWAVLSYKILDPDIWPRHEDALYTLGIFAKLFKKAAPGVWSEVEVSFEADQQMLRRELGPVIQAKVVYGAWANSIRFPAAALAMPLSAERQEDCALLEAIAKDAEAKRLAMPLRRRVEEAILSTIENSDASEEAIARQMGVSERTLRRQLSDEGVTFRKILEDCRMRSAAHYLRRTGDIPLSEIALRLGYSDQSNFTRAFSRWSGLAPQAWRRTFVSGKPGC